MFYALFTDANGVTYSNLYHSHDEYYRDTFSPCTEIHTMIDFAIPGKTYRERRENLRNIACAFQSASCMSAPKGGSMIDLSYGELADIYSWFERNGRRYGLLREFRENCIC